MSASTRHYRRRSALSIQECIVCGSKAIGFNFGAPTCAPCKAFFRRNARRQEVLHASCQFTDLIEGETDGHENLEAIGRCSDIRRCASCRLHRCFEVGMKEELVRTDEQNERHKQLVDNNRKRRSLFKQEQKLRENRLPARQRIVIGDISLNEMDWSHLSSVVYAYDTCCLKVYLEQRANMFLHGALQNKAAMEFYALLPMSLVFSLGAFLRRLPAFQSLSRIQQSCLCKNNLRQLMLVNNHELNQSCFSEPWQTANRQASWQFLCGSKLYRRLAHAEVLAERSWITDPIVTRLWIVVLFFSTSLFCYYTSGSSIKRGKKISSLVDIQNAYATLLWKYLLHRHGYVEAVRIYSNLMHVFLNMLHVGASVNIRLRTREEFITVHEMLDRVASLYVSTA